MGSDDTAKHKRSGTGRPILIALVFAGAVGLSYFGSAAVLNRGDSSSETPDDGTAAAGVACLVQTPSSAASPHARRLHC